MQSQGFIRQVFFSGLSVLPAEVAKFEEECWINTGSALLFERNEYLAVKLAMLADQKDTYNAVMQLQETINDLTGLDVTKDGIFTEDLLRTIDICSAQDENFLPKLRFSL